MNDVRRRIVWLAAAHVVAVACSNGRPEARTVTSLPPPKPVCLVLSVGAERGLAHIGVLRALRERGIPIRCVFGTSIGALIGGLYAADPDHDTGEVYRVVVADYTKRARTSAAIRGALGSLLLGAVVAASGGEAIDVFTAGTVGAAVGVSSVRGADQARLIASLDTTLGGIRIEGLPVQFTTWHQRVTDAGVETVTVRSGNLAQAIGQSVANPMLFPNVVVREGTRLDPGADRMSAVPLDDACRLRPDAHFIVSNVTDSPAVLRRDMACTYAEIMVATPAVHRAGALTGQGADFEALVDAGYAACRGVRL